MNNFQYSLLVTAALFLATSLSAQTSKTQIRKGEYYGTTTINGTILKVLIIDGDTLPVIDLDDVQVSTKRNFKDRNERKRYHQWRKYAAKVYPYAAEAIKLFRRMEIETAEMKKGKRRKYSKKLEKELKPKYEEQLKNLTKTQGYILIKMVERELGKQFFDVLVQLEGKWAAFKWQSLGKWYGYNLKKGYNAEQDPLLELILQDLNISYKD
ncbi:MAG: DUF4294 domain-containing protein [Aureispira sp.]|nr:DUF4294 domain-containing protein [Aureispira sp.]